MNTGTTRPAIVALTLGTLILLALAPAQLVLRKAVGREPYPQLMMPSFGSQDSRSDAVNARHLALVGISPDGTERELDVAAVLPRSQTLPMIIAGEQFQHRSVIEKPESLAWLAQRIDEAYPAAHVRSLRIVWSEETILIPSGAHSSSVDPEATFTVDLPANGRARR